MAVKAKRILGIDPGLQLTGYGVLELPAPPPAADNTPPPTVSPLSEPALLEAGVLRFKSTDPVATRLALLHADLKNLISEHKPDVMVIEKLYAHYKHPNTAIIMGHARGVILLAAQTAGLEIVDLPANEVKKAVSGYGHASKDQMQQAVQAQFNLPEPPSPPDVADAIAIALTHARRMLFDDLE